MDEKLRSQREASLQKRYGKLMAAAAKGPGAGGPGARAARSAAAAGSDSSKHTAATVKRLMKYVLQEKLRVITALACVIISSITTLAASYMLRPIINTYIVPMQFDAANMAGLFRSLMVMLIVYLIGVAATYIQSRMLMVVAQNCLQTIRTELFEHMQKLPVKYYDKTARGDMMSRFTNDVDNIGNMLSSTLVSLFSSVLTLTGTLCLMLYTSVVLTVVTIVLMPVLMFITGRILKASGRFYHEQQSSLGQLNGYIEESITGQKVIKVFNHEETACEEFDILNEKLKKNQLLAQFFGGVVGPVMTAFTQVNYGCTAVVGGVLCVLRGFDIGGLTVFLNYTKQFSRPFSELSMTMTTLLSALAGAERVFAVMDEAPETADAADAHDGSEIKGDVRFENVSFGYNDDRMVLKNISLYAHPGQKIAFVGSTGAGKTTVTNLLNRFYDIQQGEITIDGISIKDYKRDELRRNIAMVLQDTHLFTGTVMENIRYGRLDATDEEVIAAAKTASADSFIRRLPEGYNTVIEGDGANLSQGQRQLLNIARASVSNAPILVLDEATSSVDTRTEKHIEHGMDRLMKNRTTFVIAHRLSTVRDAEAIMVLEHGEIIERGNHEDLLKLKGRYYELYTGRAELD